MIAPLQLRSTRRSESPASIIDEAESRKRRLVHSDERSPYLPTVDLNKKTKKIVRFQVARSEELNSDFSSSILSSCPDGSTTTKGAYWSRAEIRGFRRKGQEEARAVTTESPACALDIAAAFQECLEKKQVSQPIVQRLCSSLDCRRLRGLESQALPLLREQRLFHTRSLLLIQDRCRDQDPQTRQHILKTRSMQTSRTFRSMARILAAIDSCEVAAIVRKELVEANNYFKKT
jgi:hypothetical protein